MNSLTSNICAACGKNKKRGFAFCFACHSKLPKYSKRALTRPLFNGYQEAHAEALEILERGVDTRLRIENPNFTSMPSFSGPAVEYDPRRYRK